MKKVFFAMLPTLILLLGAESAVRILKLDTPQFTNLGFGEERFGLAKPDPELFWSLVPGWQGSGQGITVEVNSQGFRGEEIPAEKKPNEFRILCLGESTTFGVQVSQNQTYSVALQNLLSQKNPQTEFHVINAGVFAYSSFQSLKFLELRGLKLKPDLIVFYHEVNDYLPSTLRNSNDNEVGALKTDKEYYLSKSNHWNKQLVQYSALYRFLRGAWMKHRMNRFKTQSFQNPLLEVGLPNIGIPNRLRKLEKGQAQEMTDVDERALGRRVSDKERLENLSNLVALCKKHGIKLIIVHPSYQESTPHECLLTRFCKENNVLMYEAFPALHPEGETPGSLFLDLWHPNPVGHQRLADGLMQFIEDHQLLEKQ